VRGHVDDALDGGRDRAGPGDGNRRDARNGSRGLRRAGDETRQRETDFASRRVLKKASGLTKSASARWRASVAKAASQRLERGREYHHQELNSEPERVPHTNS
jgi:hypothetical protein